MAAKLEITISDRNLEGLLLYLDTIEGLSLTHKQMLCEKAAKWLELANPLTYCVGFQNLAIYQSHSGNPDIPAQSSLGRQASPEAAESPLSISGRASP